MKLNRIYLSNKTVINTISAFCLISPLQAKANIFYYNNAPMGDRAIGLGGAFTGVADDASGVIFNPAGLGFAQGNSISASANAYTSKKVTYRKIIGDDNFVEKSDGFFPSFIGSLKRLDNIWDGLVGAFAIYATDYEFQDQDDYISESALAIKSFHRTVNKKSTVVHGAIAVGRRFGEFFSFGLGCGIQKLDVLEQEYQDVGQIISKTSLKINANALAKGEMYAAQTSNKRLKLNAWGVEPSFGMQTVLFEKLSLGLMLRKTIYFSQGLEFNGDATRFSRFANGDIISESDLVSEGATAAQLENKKWFATGKIEHKTPNNSYSTDGKAFHSEIEDPFLSGPMELRFGAALFASTRLLIAGDVSHQFAVESHKSVALSRLAITNYALGMEYYLTPGIPFRLGAFTNLDSRPKVETGKTGQADHVDFYGLNSVISWAQPASQIGVGASVQKGQGKSQKLAGVKDIQNVDGFAWTALLSTTYYLN